MNIDAKLIDYEKVLKSVENLRNVEKNKVIKKGISDAIRLIIRSGKSNLNSRLIRNPEVYATTGNLKKSFSGKIKKSKLGGLAGFTNLGHHAHLVDLGTKIRRTKKGYNRGKVIGNKFWTDAIDANINSAINVIYSGIERAIEKLILRQ